MFPHTQLNTFPSFLPAFYSHSSSGVAIILLTLPPAPPPHLTSLGAGKVWSGQLLTIIARCRYVRTSYRQTLPKLRRICTKIYKIYKILLYSSIACVAE